MLFIFLKNIRLPGGFTMKLTVKRDLLVDCLTKVGKVVSAKPSTPILGGFLISVTKDELRITGSNSTETIIHSIPVDGESLRVEESGKCVLPKAVEGIFKKCNKELTLEFDGLSGVVTSGKRQTELVSLDAEEYPKIQVDTEVPTLSVNGEQFKDIVRKTAFAASTSDIRPILQGVCFHVKDEDCIWTCTDSHRLAKIVHVLPEPCKEEKKIVVPAKALDSASKVFDLSKDIEVFPNGQNNIALKNGETLFFSRLFDGNYPQTDRLIPTDGFRTVVTLNREELINGLEYIKEVTEGIVRLETNGMVLTLSSNGQSHVKGSDELVPLSIEGEDIKIAFSVKFALDALKAIDTNEVDLLFQGAMRPFLIKPKESTMDEIQLILPVRQS